MKKRARRAPISMPIRSSQQHLLMETASHLPPLIYTQGNTDYTLRVAADLFRRGRVAEQTRAELQMQPQLRIPFRGRSTKLHLQVRRHNIADEFLSSFPVFV
ncbi:MAG: hypothetical protein GX592_04010 [Clostridiales bacterium]|nr:hypothetical protein [Clostridiales bacterium]